MSERELEVAMLHNRIDHATDVIADLRDALAKIYAHRGEDKLIAESCARSDIECYCRVTLDREWYSTADLTASYCAGTLHAIRYLELRGLVKRHPENLHLVKLL